MSIILPFVKMHGIGNDFVVTDHLSSSTPSIQIVEAEAALLCDRKYGIGGDGVICVLPAESDDVDFAYRMFNPDGSEAEMCGNGIRCFGKYVFERGYTDKTAIRVATKAGVKVLHLNVADGVVDSVRVDMGEPGVCRADLPMRGENGPVTDEPITALGETVRITGVSMGNPHVVFFVESATDELINRIGPALETHESFPRRTNVHAVEVIGPGEVKMLTWERGAGRTLACGTGACAVAVASVVNGHTNRDVVCHLPGGDLQIEWSETDNHVYMTGAAAHVFTGTIEI